MKNRILLIGIITCLFACSREEDKLNMKQMSARLTSGGALFVAVDGNNANAGTIGSPFRTITHALTVVTPGDTIFVRGGVYNERLDVNVSGTSGNYITLRAYQCETAILDGTGISPRYSGRTDGLVNLRNVSWFVMEGFDIRNYISTVPWYSPDGILANKGSSHLVIRNNRIYNVEHNVPLSDGRGAHGIHILGDTSVVMTDILIEENQVHDCNTGYSENLTVNGYVDNFQVLRNKVYNGENIGIAIAGGYAANPNPLYNYARNGVVAGNEIYKIDALSGLFTARGAIAIYVDGARNILVDRNKIFDCDRGIGLVSENDNFQTRDCIVRNNLVFNCWLTGIYIGGYIGHTGGGTYECYIINNTLYKNNRTTGFYGEVEGEIRLTENCYNNKIANNLIYGYPGNEVFIHKYTSTGSGNVIDRNLYYSDGGYKWIWAGTPHTTFSTWKTASGADATSVSGSNPLLKVTPVPDASFLTGSPAYLTGTILPGGVHGSLDIFNLPRTTSGQISIGAYQGN